MIKDDASIVKPAFTHLQKSFRSGKTLDIKYRKEQLTNFLKGIQDLESKFHNALELDLHGSLTFSSLFSHGICAETVRKCLAQIDDWVKPVPVDTPIYMAPAKSYIHNDPYGVVLIMGAWNYPFYLTLTYMAFAISAGNCVIIKPSELAANSSNVMAELVDKYLDKDCYQCIEGAAQVSKAITAEPFDKIMFTGGTEKGKLVAKAAADNLIPCILELGGKSPTIVNREADLENAALRIARARLMNCGQLCVACDYAFVHKDVKDKFIESYKQKVVKFYGEDASKSLDYGRIINVAHTKRLKSYLDEKHGGKVLMGGQVDVEKRYVAPTLIENPKPESQVMQNEIFGPILPLYEFTDISEVIDFINNRSKPLALYYYGSEKSQDFKLLRVRTSSGGLVCNDSFTQLGNTYLPFGGVGASGYGSVTGFTGFKAFSHPKAVMECHTNNGYPANMLFPPYNEKARKMMNYMKYVNFSQSAVPKFCLFLITVVLLLVLLNYTIGSKEVVEEVAKGIGRKDL